MTDLKPCPFCGGEARYSTYDPYDGYQGDCTTHVVRCRDCKAKIERRTKEEVIEAWNRRHPMTVYGFPLEQAFEFGMLVKASGLTPEELGAVMKETELYLGLLQRLWREEMDRQLEELLKPLGIGTTPNPDGIKLKDGWKEDTE